MNKQIETAKKLLDFCIEYGIGSLSITSNKKPIYGIIEVTTNFQDKKLYTIAETKDQYISIKAFCINQIKNDNTIIGCLGLIQNYELNIPMIDDIYIEYLNSINQI